MFKKNESRDEYILRRMKEESSLEKQVGGNHYKDCAIQPIEYIEKNNLTFAKVDEEKRMLVSPALIPNKQIFRYNPNTDSEYYVYFSPETVRKASELYLKHNNHHKATYEHQDRVSGVLTVESWIKEGDMDKSKLYGYDLPNGTWFVKMKINNEELWQKIKAGELKGLSIEGYFTDKMEKMAEKTPTDQEILEALNEIIRENQIK
jgi:hypothetical protein